MCVCVISFSEKETKKAADQSAVLSLALCDDKTAARVPPSPAAMDALMLICAL